MGPIRTIVEERQKNIVIMDVFSKLVQERIIFIGEAIDSDLANAIIAQMLYLDSLDHKKPINVYINSPGGSIYAGLAIFDASELITAPIRTVCMGVAASMGAVLMLMGKERCITKRARMMLHQPSSGIVGTADEIRVEHEEVQLLKNQLYQLIEEKSNLRNAEQLFKLDTWYGAKEALEAGLVNKIL